MKTVLKGLTTAALIAAAVTAPASAQQKSWGFGVHGAYFKSGTLAKSGTTDSRLQLDNKRDIGASLEAWFGSGRVGLRANVDKTNSPWIIDNDVDPNSPAVGGAQAQLDAAGKNVDVLAGDANFMLRLLAPTMDRRFAPFISLGGGWFKWDQQTDSQPIDLRVNEVDAQIQGNHQVEPVITGSLGTDFFLTNNVALRLEAKDYYNWSSPYVQLSTLGSADSEHHGGTHNMFYSAGLAFLFGGNRVEEPGFIAAAPAPTPPPPAPAPAPAPRPTTEQVAMCVVNANGQLETVQATRNLGTREITVMRNGQSVAFATAYPANNPIYVQGAPWYVASRPLVVDLTGPSNRVDNKLDNAVDDMPDNRIELVTFGTTGPMPTGDLLYIGSVDGVPLYAKRMDIDAALLPDLQAKLRVSQDIEEILNDDPAFADRFASGISNFYLAYGPGEQNCTYQPVSSTRVVRQTRG